VTTRCAQALLTGLVDYAGLFPPAGLALADALAEHARWRASPQAWLLGRFVVPASRLDELAQGLQALPAAAASPWRLSALLGPDTRPQLDAVEAFNRAQASRACVDSVELKAASAEEAEVALARLPAGLFAHVELPPAAELPPLLAVLSGRGARAKLRTGGVAPEAFPTAAEVARFVTACASAGVAWKATAGLHHPVRGEHALSRAPAAPRAAMHGFLNLFAAAAFAHGGASAAEIESVLLETDPAAFALGEEALSWRYLSASTAALAESRAAFASSFGSCSIAEPVADLQALGVIE
jgi:hypothetical protein